MIAIERRALLAGSAALFLPAIARAQNWQPSRPVQLIAGFAPGGGSDVIARTIAQAAAEFSPQPLVVVNRPGAGGALGAEFVSRAAPDGHTLLLAGGSESTSIPAHRDLPYDPQKSFRAVIRLTRHPHFICVRGKGGKFSDMRQVLAAAREAPGKLTHGSAGAGSLSHSLFILLERRANLQFLHVPYTGGGPVAQALLTGEIDMGVQASDELGGLVTSGDIKPIAVASAERAPSQPEVPTLRELGFDVVADNQKGWVGPAGMSDALVSYWHGTFRRAIDTPVWKAFLTRLGEQSGYADGPAFQAAMDKLLTDIRQAMGRA